MRDRSFDVSVGLEEFRAGWRSLCARLVKFLFFQSGLSWNLLVWNFFQSSDAVTLSTAAWMAPTASRCSRLYRDTRQTAPSMS